MHLHILGICGTFMGGIAALARESGHTVTGCDANVYPPMSDQLRSLGIALHEGYDAAQIALAPDVFVIGNAIVRGNPLLEAILDRDLPYTSGPQWLAEHVLHGRHVLAVAGTHGKTTTTAMLAWILEQAGQQPGFLIGGVPLNFDVSARLGGVGGVGNAAALESPALGSPRNALAANASPVPSSPLHASALNASPLSTPFVIEADEYDTAFFDKRSKFIHYRPRTLVLNNLEFDHADIFDDVTAIERQFHHLVRTIAARGRLIVNARDESLRRVLAMGCWSEMLRFGARKEEPGALRARGEPHAFDVLRGAMKIARVEWPLIGEHNQLNALAAIAAAEHVGVAPEAAAKSLASFQSVKRRLEVRGEVAGITVYDDFAHHPTAIRSTIDGMRRKVGNARILVAFEPRSNTMKLGSMKAQLPWSLEEADLAFCSNASLSWNVSEALAPMGERAVVTATFDELVTRIVSGARTGDHIVCMSNGGFGGVHQKLLDGLTKRVGFGSLADATAPAPMAAPRA